MLWKLLSFMDKKVFSNHVICLTDIGPVGERIVSLGIPVYSVNLQSGRITPKGIITLWKLFRSIRPAVLQTWLYHADLLGLIFGKLSSIKHIYWNVRCSYMELDNYRFSTRLTRKLCSLFSSFPDAILTNSKKARVYHQSIGYRAKRWEVVPNGFDITRLRPNGDVKSRIRKELGVPNNSLKGNKRSGPFFLIGLIARYDPMKGHETFIRAACHLLQERIDVHFILAGRDVEWGNRELASQIPAAFHGHFHLLGQISDTQTITAALDIASSASLGEGFSNTVGEAMACGVPCVVTDVGDSSYLVGDTGLVVPPRDPVSMAEAWQQILAMSNEARRDLGISARNRIISKFPIARVVKRYENIYSSPTEEIK